MSDSFDLNVGSTDTEFYLRFYSGGYKDNVHGHEFLEFDIRHNPGDKFATLRYANQTNYRNEELIRKQVCISLLVLEEILCIVKESQILLESDVFWPKAERESKQEIEIRCGNKKKVLKTVGRLSLVSIKGMNDAESLKIVYYLVQDLKTFIFSLISLHFKVNPLFS